jgi:hypothetical protein
METPDIPNGLCYMHNFFLESFFPAVGERNIQNLQAFLSYHIPCKLHGLTMISLGLHPSTFFFVFLSREELVHSFSG